MTALSLLFAFAVFFALGAGIVLLLNRGGIRFGPFEFAALSWLFGTGGVSFALWLGGVFLLRGIALQVEVTVLTVAILVAGLRQTPPTKFLFTSRSTLDYALAAVIAVGFALFCLSSYKHTLGWDGVVNWELKARYAFLNDGALPAEYFSTAGRSFTHPDYPLGIPFTELWVYLSLGAPHQFWAKSIFIVFYVSGATLLASFSSRLAGRNWIGLLVAILLLITPQVTIGTGGATTGYADFPLSAIYLAAIGFLTLAALSDEPAAFRLYAGCLALLPWFKREGVVLWVVAAVASVFLIVGERRGRRALALLPGLAVICSWKIFLLARHTVASADFSFAGPDVISRLPHRAAVIGAAVLSELANFEQWSMLWVLFAVAVCFLVLRRRSRGLVILIWAIFMPMALYSATYLFSAWPVFERHIETSLPRLLMHVAPLAWVTIAMAIARGQNQWPYRLAPATDACATPALARHGLVGNKASDRPIA